MRDIALHILDIAQNSISAGATLVNIEVLEKTGNDRLILSVSDNGPGMDNEVIMKVADPFYTTRRTRKVGLGIPLLKQNAEQAGGSFTISSDRGKGTTVTAVFIHSHWDRPPKGDIPGVISILAGANPSMDFLYRHTVEDFEYIFDTREIKLVLEDVPLSDPEVIRYMKEMIEENLSEIAET